MVGKNICFDLDNTLCSIEKTFEKSLATPKQNVIDVCNKLYDDGNNITIFTARSWAEYKMTEHWLKTNGVKYHLLLCGKPLYDIFVDDKTMHPDDIEKLKGK